MLMQSDPERAETLLHQAEASVRARWQHYKELAALSEVKAEHDGH
jgi:pyruvate-ferredoxin/flavodoxin oxidoreductase